MDTLIIGCGLSGAVIARYIAETLGKKVIIWERRNHIGGNMFDYYDEHGILAHKYGPHIFHTSDKSLYDYICRFGDWQDFKLTCMAQIDGKFTPTPFNFTTIDQFYSPQKSAELKRRIKNYFGNQNGATVTELLEHSDDLIREYAEFLFEKDYSLYAIKQWGIAPNKIDKTILGRLPIRFSHDVGYFDDTYQVLPSTNYTDFFNNLLNHPNIQVKLGLNALEHLTISESGTDILIDGAICDMPVIYTGAIDELFGLSNGALPYRSLKFEWHYENIDSFQDAPVVAYPQADGFTRITEYKKLPVQNVIGTSYAVEFPLAYTQGSGDEPYYPVLTEQSKAQYAWYKEKADSVTNLYCCGRLADFKYYNMDNTLKRAIDICNTLSHKLI